MIAVSDRFLDSLRETHRIKVTARLYRPSAPTVPIEVPVIGGTVTADGEARTRRQATLDIAFALSDPLTPEVARELPFGGYAVIERGIRYTDIEDELVQLGRFRIESVTWVGPEGSASLTLADRMAQVADEPFLTPYIPTGLKASAAIVAIVTEVFGSSITYNVSTTPASEPALGAATVFDADRAQAISDLAASISAEAFFDNFGNFVLRPQPDGSGDPVWTIDAGERGVLVGAVEALDRSNVKNGVAVRGQAAANAAPFFSLAVDDDLASPTLWGGPFGKVANIVSLTSVATQAQADEAALSMLDDQLALSRTITLRGAPNPALEPGDLIQIDYADGRSETQLVTSAVLGLGPDGALDLITKAHFHPAEGFSALSVPSVRVYTGETAWRELEEAV